MAYSVVGIIAVLIHFIVNFDVFLNLRGKKRFAGEKFYLLFLIGVMAYHTTDGFWGILYDAKLVTAVFVDTTIYFSAMATSILLWGLFVSRYLESKNKLISYAGIAIFTFQIVLIITNFFYPILFKVTEDCVYEALPLRYVMLVAQIAMFLIIAVYTLLSAKKNKGFLRRHYLTISLFGLFMIVAITLQVFFPLMPMYSLGYLFGITALHTFVVQDEKEVQEQRLQEATYRVSTDQLTGTLSKYAYVDMEAQIDEKIRLGVMEDFAIILFDLNDLKVTNDTRGHQAGDHYILDSVNLIKEYFKDYPLFRVGGDEFVVILMGEGYQNKDKLLKDFNQKIDENVNIKGAPVIAVGLAYYLPEKDGTTLQTFSRADREMYARKRELKERQGKGNKN